LFDVEISHLQGKRQIPFFAHEDLFPNLPLSLLLPKYSKAMAHHFSTNMFLIVQKKCHSYNYFILCHIEDETID
jgi:hypothetical protein